MDTGKKDAVQMYLEGKTWGEIVHYFAPEFPHLTDIQVLDKVRGSVRKSPEYKAKQNAPPSPTEESIEIRADGSRVATKVIAIKSANDITPEFLIEAHGFSPDDWELVSAKNNFYEVQQKGGDSIPLYQSKITLKPISEGFNHTLAIKAITAVERRFTPLQVKPTDIDSDLLLVCNIADLHLGKLAWSGETGENYDYKIASSRFNYVVDDIVNRCGSIGSMLFPIGNDFFNFDTPTGTTTYGTPQDNDLRWGKMFEVGVELLYTAIHKLAEVAPIQVFLVSGNHDLQTSFYAIHAVKQHFKDIPRVSVDTDLQPRKYFRHGQCLIGFTHGKDEGRRISSIMQVEAADLWGKTKYRELLAAHLHSEQATLEVGGQIIRRVSSVTGTDMWHKKSGFIGQIQKCQHFIYSADKGLYTIYNTAI